MVRLHQAANLQEAYLLRDLLAQAGVEALLFNEHAQGALGELPFIEVFPELWLADADQRDRAEAVLAAYQHGSDATRHCPACGEDNPGTFETCWQCGEPLP